MSAPVEKSKATRKGRPLTCRLHEACGPQARTLDDCTIEQLAASLPRDSPMKSLLPKSPAQLSTVLGPVPFGSALMYQLESGKSDAKSPKLPALPLKRRW